MSNSYKIIEIGSSCLHFDPCQHACVCESLDGEQKTRILTGAQIIESGHDLIVNDQKLSRHFADRLKTEKTVVNSPNKTLFIAHRGNFKGPDPATENHPEQIDRALQMGYDYEIDLRQMEGRLWLGHDGPQYCITPQWLEQRAAHLWIHCKNYAALEYCLADRALNCFWHQSDDYTLTSHGFIWAYPGQPGGKSTIAVMPETRSPPHALREYYAVCSDYVDSIGLFDEQPMDSTLRACRAASAVCACRLSLAAVAADAVDEGDSTCGLGDKVWVKSRRQIGEILEIILTSNGDKNVLVEFSNGQIVGFPETELRKIWSTTHDK